MSLARPIRRPPLGGEVHAREVCVAGLARDAQPVGGAEPQREQPRRDASGMVEARSLAQSPALDDRAAHKEGPVAPRGRGLGRGRHAATVRAPTEAGKFSAREGLDGAVCGTSKISRMDHDTAEPDRRDLQIKARVTRAEHDEIRAAAEAEGLDVASFSRRAALREARRVNGGAR